MNKYRLLPEITKLPVEFIAGSSFVVGNTNVPSIERLPVIDIDPVTWWVSSKLSPNLDDPDTNNV